MARRVRPTANESGLYSIPSGGARHVHDRRRGRSGFEEFRIERQPRAGERPGLHQRRADGRTDPSETVEVAATATELQTESDFLGSDRRRKTDSGFAAQWPQSHLPLALLKPGVRGGSLAGFSFDLTMGGLNMNGSRTQDNLITYDGVVAVSHALERHVDRHGGSRPDLRSAGADRLVLRGVRTLTGGLRSVW